MGTSQGSSFVQLPGGGGKIFWDVLPDLYEGTVPEGVGRAVNPACSRLCSEPITIRGFGAGANLGEVRQTYRVEPTSKWAQVRFAKVIFHLNPEPMEAGNSLGKDLGRGAVGRAAFRAHYGDKSAFLS